VSRAADAIELFASDGITPMMNRFNRKEEKEREEHERDQSEVKNQGKNEDRTDTEDGT
jgi:hypothetical protein